MSHTAGAKRYCLAFATVSTARGAWRSLCVACVLAAAVAAGPGGAVADHANHHGMPMSDEAMKAEAAAYWATHEPVGTGPVSPEAPQVVTATFSVVNFAFENNSPAQVDTAKILVGESVQWNWSAGFHTITNGTDSFDPNAGTLFNQPSDSAHPTFTFTFNSTGTFPFFCSFHELQNMRGIVVVSTPTGVDPPTAGPALGFTRDPAPNPTHTGASFHYAMRAAGRARAEVFDAAGRRVAVLVDRDQPAGAYTAVWDGLTPAGPADTGVYYVRLTLPGYDQSRSIVIQR